MKYNQVEGGQVTDRPHEFTGVCEFCGQKDCSPLYDAKTKEGPWAEMCDFCFGKQGVGLGIGRGQKYERL